MGFNSAFKGLISVVITGYLSLPKKIRIFDNINKPDFSNTFTSVELNLYHKQFMSYPHARTLPLRQRAGAAPDAYRVLVGKLEGTRPVGRPWCRWDSNTKMIFKKWWALVNVAMNLEVPKNAGNFMTR